MSTAQVVVLAGPSGAGKSRLAERLGLPVLRLDDFYKDGDDPSLPRITHGANAGLVDWDHPDSWHEADALAALRELCATGRTEVPVYEIARNGRCGTHTVELYHIYPAPHSNGLIVAYLPKEKVLFQGDFSLPAAGQPGNDHVKALVPALEKLKVVDFERYINVHASEAPQTKAEATWSAHPATTGTPSERPRCPAASGWSRPTTSSLRRIGGSSNGSIPASATSRSS